MTVVADELGTSMRLTREQDLRRLVFETLRLLYATRLLKRNAAVLWIVFPCFLKILGADLTSGQWFQTNSSLSWRTAKLDLAISAYGARAPS
jgi:hypothetical protein